MDRKAFASSLSTLPDWKSAVREACGNVLEKLGDAPCDLAVCFVSEPYPGLEGPELAAALQENLPYRVLIGCNSSGVVGAASEVEMRPAVTLLGMHLPGVRLYPFSFSQETGNSIISSAGLLSHLDLYPNEKPRFLLLADPMTCDIVELLGHFNNAYKGLPVVGGLASGAVMGAANKLFMNGQSFGEGAVGVAMTGDVDLEIVVSQGCRPIGRPLVITRAEHNVLYELSGRPAIEQVRTLIGSLRGRDRQLAENTLSVGLVMEEKHAAFGRGDFLIRNIMGFDPDSGALLVGATLHTGQTVQFQVRDAETSTEDLLEQLRREPAYGDVPHGGLLVSCCGRGQNFFGVPDHDIGLIRSAKGTFPMAGFFANGEIGPVGGRNFVHGYTSSLVIFR
ncbi:MAG: hypothetical protein MOGMAGMI_02076 [Candidatus Omnitrophica bacterium]|nr:hypothetical protein [Candidatus Omnitrophota bacterium]